MVSTIVCSISFCAYIHIAFFCRYVHIVSTIVCCNIFCWHIYIFFFYVYICILSQQLASAKFPANVHMVREHVYIGGGFHIHDVHILGVQVVSHISFICDIIHSYVKIYRLVGAFIYTNFKSI